MQIVTLSIKEAEEFLAKHERHYKVPVEALCAIGVGEGGDAAARRIAELEAEISRLRAMTPGTFVRHGAAILGRRDAECGELAHIYCDGTSQGYSLLYGAVWRAFKALGYEKAVL